MIEILSVEDAVNAIQFLCSNDIVKCFFAVFFICGCSVGFFITTALECFIEYIINKIERKERGEKE